MTTKWIDREALVGAIGGADTHLGDCPREEHEIMADAVIAEIERQSSALEAEARWQVS